MCCAGEVFGQRALAVHAATKVEANVPRNPDKPRSRSTGYVIEPTPGDQERLSGHVVGNRRIAPPNVSPNRLEMLIEEAREALFSCQLVCQRSSS